MLQPECLKLPQNSYEEAPTPSVTIFGDKDFIELIKVNWGHKGEPGSNRISVLIWRDRRELSCELALSTMWHRGRAAICKPGREPSPWTEMSSTLILEFQPSELWEISICYLPPRLWYFLMADWANKYKLPSIKKKKKICCYHKTYCTEIPGTFAYSC